MRVLAGPRRRITPTLGVISGFYRPVGSVGDMGGGSLEVALALDDHVGDVSVSLPLGALPVEAMLAMGRDEAKREIDERLRVGLPTVAVEADVLRRRRRLARARQGAYGARQGPCARHPRLRLVGRRGARFRQVDLAGDPGQAAC